VVGTDKSVEAPPGVSAAQRLFHRDVAVPETTLAGLTGLPERSGPRSGVVGSAATSTSFPRPRGIPQSGRPNGPKTARQLPRLRLPLRVRAAVPSPVMPDRVAPPGVSRPFSDIGRGIRMTRVCLTRHTPSSGFLAPSTVCSPSGLEDTLGPLPLLGFSPSKPFRAARPGRLSASAASCRPWCSTASNSEEYEVESSMAFKTLEPIRPGPTAVVPRPRSPLRSTSFPNRRKGFRPRSSPHTLEPSAAGRTIPLRAGASGTSTDPGTGGSTRDPQLPWGSCCIRKTLWRLPVLYSIRDRHPRRSRRFSGAFGPLRTHVPVARSVRPLRVTGLSKSF